MPVWFPAQHFAILGSDGERQAQCRKVRDALVGEYGLSQMAHLELADPRCLCIGELVAEITEGGIGCSPARISCGFRVVIVVVVSGKESSVAKAGGWDWPPIGVIASGAWRNESCWGLLRF